MRLIDADAFLNRIDAEPLTFDGGVDINDLEKIIKTQPTIEQKQGVLVAKKDVMETLKTTLADGMLLDTLELRVNDLPTIEPKQADDLISRADVIEAIARLHVLNDEKEIRRAYKLNPHSTMTDFEDTLVSAFDAIYDIPSAQPKQGEWIETSEGTMCSNCHKYPYDDGEYHIANWHSDFCPNCGARMKGADDE